MKIALDASSVGRYPCDICGKVYRQAGTRNRHKKNHFNVSFKCWMCPSEFSRRYTLQNHIRDIHGMLM
ncbi:hypothetical protein JTE90_028034 [Oedothorax gibbosus]|uniref:C2H2-type domain-containing protein n=1 Tax=Oedothorax gibbosus TaxID=931172 RepID=A0AAV6TWB4_9ARAC|nr:hypothetical protein JTE90_028034 [Oedothorax gibbosus]